MARGKLPGRFRGGNGVAHTKPGKTVKLGKSARDYQPRIGDGTWDPGAVRAGGRNVVMIGLIDEYLSARVYFGKEGFEISPGRERAGRIIRIADLEDPRVGVCS